MNIELCVCIFGAVVLFSFTSLSRLFHSYRGFDPHSGRHVVYLFRLPLNAKLYAKTWDCLIRCPIVAPTHIDYVRTAYEAVGRTTHNRLIEQT